MLFVFCQSISEVFNFADDTEDFHTLDLESHHPGVLRLEGGPNKECETVRNILFGVTGPTAFLDPTAGLVSAGMSVASWQVCNKMATPQREVFSCCGGERSSAGKLRSLNTQKISDILKILISRSSWPQCTPSCCDKLCSHRGEMQQEVKIDNETSEMENCVSTHDTVYERIIQHSLLGHPQQFSPVHLS